MNGSKRPDCSLPDDSSSATYCNGDWCNGQECRQGQFAYMYLL